MIAKGLIAVLAGLVACALLAAPADAQTRKKRVGLTRAGSPTVVHIRGEDGRSRTRIIVQRRSYLDPGTQVFNGERRYNDGIHPFADRPPFREFDGTVVSRRVPSGPFELPNSNSLAW